LRQNPYAKKLQTQFVSTEKLHKKLLYEKAARKILLKLTPGGRNWQLICAWHKQQQQVLTFYSPV
jgi:hypothetical protein